MKRSFLVFILLLLIISCSDQKQTKIIFYDDEIKDHDIFINGLITIFENDNPDINIIRKRISIGQLLPETQNKRIKADIIRYSSEYLEKLLKYNRFKKCTDVFDEEYLDLFIKEALSSATINNILWGIPDNYGNHILIFYNKYYINKEIKDTDELIKWAKWRTSKEYNRTGLVYPLKEPHYIFPWFAGFGADIFGKEKPEFSTKGVVDTFQFLYDLKFKHKVVPAECDIELAEKMFLSKNSSIIISNEWKMQTYLDAFGSLLGAIPLPISSDTMQYPSSLASTRSFSINKRVRGKKLEAVRSFIEFMTSEKTQKEWINQRRLPSLISLEATDDIVNDPLLSKSMQGLLKSKGKPGTSKINIIMRAIRPSLEKLMDGRISASQAALDTQNYFEELWKGYINNEE